MEMNFQRRDIFSPVKGTVVHRHANKDIIYNCDREVYERHKY